MGAKGLKRWAARGVPGLVWLGLVGCGPTDDVTGGAPEAGVPPAVAQAGIDVPPWPGAPQDGAPEADGGARAVKAIRDTRAQVGGRWASPFDMSVIAIHMVLQPDGRVLYYGSDTSGRQTAAGQYAVWDPSAAPAQAVMTLDNATGTDIFCSSQTLLADGSTLIVGGDRPGGGNAANRESTRFLPGTGSLVKGRPMTTERWYSSTTTLMDGRVYIQGGSGGQARPEIYDPRDGSFRRLEGADTGGLFYAFPSNWIAPDERVFGIDGAGRMYFVDPRGAGSLARAGALPAGVTPGSAGSAMFRPGRILALSSASAGATVIDIRRGAPQVGSTEAASARRIHGVATVLADGRVLASGGGRTNNAIGTAVLTGEVWNPVTGEWTIGPEQRNARLYHGTALLLHDGRVLVAGGGAPGPLANRNGELYSPSYLFDAEGRPAPRPRIEQAPDVLDPGRPFEVRTQGRPIARVTLVRFGSVSHSWNADQRFLELPFRADAAAGRLSVQLPSRASDTPPGFYMLFAFDDAGVPSIARTVRIVEPRPDADAIAPIVDPIDDRRWTDGAAWLQPQGRSPAGRALRWSASGLPPGLAIDPAGGTITGQPTAQGDWFVTVAADDGEHTGTQSFLWSIRPSDVRFDRIDAPGPVELGRATEFVARAQGAGLTYTWDFGDGSRVSARSASPAIRHTYARPGTYAVTLTVYDAIGRPTSRGFLQTVHCAVHGPMPTGSSMLATSGEGAQARLWVANPDAGTVTVFDVARGARLAEIRTGDEPVTLAIAGDGRVWVANRRSASLSVIEPTGFGVVATVALPRGSAPYGVVADASGSQVFVALEAGGQLLRFDARTLARTGGTAIGPDVRHLALTGDGRTLYASRFITPPLPGESGRTVRTGLGGGEVIRVDAQSMRVVRTIALRHGNREDGETQGRGVPNYLGAMAISPDGTQAYVPSKQDNIARGRLRDGRDLDFQNTVRAVSSRIRIAAQDEDLPGRIDHDNASLASAAAFDPLGALLFVALETSAEVAVHDAHTGQPLLRLPVGLAPRALRVSSDGLRLYVANYMGRSVSVFDLGPLRRGGQLDAPLIATLRPMAVEPLAPQVLLGKQLFHDASDPRLARDRYMSCASCHADGGGDGRTWDFTGFGEGLRNTVPLRGRAGIAHGRLHWSGNFDEIQDFEGQIRRFAGGTGLMSDAAWTAGSRAAPLGDRTAGLSVELDALATYVASLNRFDPSPYRAADGSLTEAGRAGEALFVQKGCTECHGGRDFTASARRGTVDIGTIRQPTSGGWLGQALTGIDPPTLRDAWSSAPYLHDGSAPTLVAAIRAHRDLSATDAEVASLARYVAEIGDGPAPSTGSDPVPGEERPGLLGTYFEGIVPGQGAVRAVRNEAVDFDWGTGAPPGATADRFSVRWTGTLVAPTSGRYRFRTLSDDGVRLWVGGASLIDAWTLHAVTAHTSGWVSLEAGGRYPLRLDYFENHGGATLRLQWRTPEDGTWRPVPASVLRSPAAGG